MDTTIAIDTVDATTTTDQRLDAVSSLSLRLLVAMDARNRINRHCEDSDVVVISDLDIRCSAWEIRNFSSHGLVTVPTRRAQKIAIHRERAKCPVLALLRPTGSANLSPLPE